VDNNANTQDARLILQLRAMCRDPDMHSARLPENAWLGQVISYWGMAAALVAQGTLGEHALLSADFSEGLFEVFCKLRPFLADLRRRTRKPGLLRNIQDWLLEVRRAASASPLCTNSSSHAARKCHTALQKQASLCRSTPLPARSNLLQTRGRSPHFVGLRRPLLPLSMATRRSSLNTYQFGDFQVPAVANSCSPIANCPASTGTQYTTRARERKFPSSDRTFRRSFGFQGLLVRMRAPRALTFSVIPSCAGVRTSRLAKSTLIFMGVRSSVRFEISMEHHQPDQQTESRLAARELSCGDQRRGASYLTAVCGQGFPSIRSLSGTP
jgi:hypothetical protein